MQPLNYEIRDENAADESAISALIVDAFETEPHSNHSEQFIVDELRKDGALSISLVATVNSNVIGHIAFSAVALSSGAAGWYGLGPLAVLPDYQKRGVGTALVKRGLQRLRELGASGCVVLGDPKFYAQFGFAPDPGLPLVGVPPEYFQAYRFTENSASGTVQYHHAFMKFG